ncbi:putative nuclease HARBI1 [Haliotis rubra]|uniref:putative nuclease HARBI1 n=1 Tax=Haliotis rubra TaxID=36100 RepID=UPI001EE5A231|nr:putative nuclease HARBI1 [Haliotis rubra]
MQLQVVCDAKLQFTDIYVGWPGSVHDCRVFKNSPLRRKLEQGYLPPDFHLIGDSAYPLAPYIMVPFKDNGHVSLAEKKFNKCHASTRVDVERAIGLLKCKFRRLKYLDMQLTEEMCNFIVAACVLHNFILMREMFHDDIIGDDDHQADELIDEEALLEGLPADAVAKRNDIALLL